MRFLGGHSHDKRWIVGLKKKLEISHKVAQNRIVWSRKNTSEIFWPKVSLKYEINFFEKKIWKMSGGQVQTADFVIFKNRKKSWNFFLNFQIFFSPNETSVEFIWIILWTPMTMFTFFRRYGHLKSSKNDPQNPEKITFWPPGPQGPPQGPPLWCQCYSHWLTIHP